MAGFNDFLNIFFGSSQSQVTAYAILAAIIAICITIFLTKTDMTIGDKFLLVLFVLLTLVPGVFLILFEITCMVTGGSRDKRWWCWLYAWVVAIFVVIYCLLVVIISFSSLFTYNNAMENIELNENKNKMSPQQSNDYAKAILETNDYKENFQNNDLDRTIKSLMINADNNEKKKEDFINEPLSNLKEEKKEISPFIGGYATFETFANKTSKTDDKDEDIKETPKKDSSIKSDKKDSSVKSDKKDNIKDEFSGSVNIEDKEEGFEDEKKELKKNKEEKNEPEAVIEPFGNMNFGVKYSSY